MVSRKYFSESRWEVTEMAEIYKGYISKIDGKKAEVVPCHARNTVTSPLVVPWHLLDALKVNDAVVYVMFEDGSGIIFEKMDGEWSLIIDGDLLVKGDAVVYGEVEADDVKTDTVSSLNSHIHGLSEGASQTMPPSN